MTNYSYKFNLDSNIDYNNVSAFKRERTPDPKLKKKESLGQRFSEHFSQDESN